MKLNFAIDQTTLFIVLVGLVTLLVLLVIALLFRVVSSERQQRETVIALARAKDEALQTALLNIKQDLQSVSTGLITSQDTQFTNFMTLMQKESTEQITSAKGLQDSLMQRLDAMRTTMAEQLTGLQSSNSKALNDMRSTVEEKLQTTLNTRISASFKTVEEQLTAVYKGLGEMRQMAQNVDGLRRVLTNVKTRGTFGEMQLGLILSEILTPEQYALNIPTRPGSAERVEFAVKLPGQTSESPVFLPIDAKFPLEDYERLLAANDANDSVMRDSARKSLVNRILSESQKIHDKYIEVPYTTEFAVLYLPIESLFSEVLAVPGLLERVHRECHITIAGPTVLAALLNSLQMGFRTLAIEKKSAEVWQLLGQVKSEFVKFTEAINGLDKKVDQMKTSIDAVRTRTNVMGRKLRDVEVAQIPVENVDSGNALPVPMNASADRGEDTLI